MTSLAVIFLQAFAVLASVFADLPISTLPPQTGLSTNYLPEPVVCGPFVTHRIYRGEKTELTDFPWSALIKHVTPRGDTNFHCGGTLIHKDFVLTAAQCVIGKILIENRWAVTDVILGEWDINTNLDCQEDLCADPVQNIPVIEQIVHEKYQPYSENYENDIALLRLSHSVEFTHWIKPLCLPVVSSLHGMKYGDDTTFILAGWGQTETVRFSNLKLKVELDSVPLADCIEKYRPVNVTLTENQICAGGVLGVSSCKGDSGSALMKLDLTNRSKPFIFLAGIMSHEPRPCGSGKQPTVFTRVDKYTDWILEHMGLSKIPFQNEHDETLVKNQDNENRNGETGFDHLSDSHEELQL